VVTTTVACALGGWMRIERGNAVRLWRREASRLALSYIVEAGIAQSFLSRIIEDADCVCFGCPVWFRAIAFGHGKPSQLRYIF
jgi:hypothetical protein